METKVKMSAGTQGFGFLNMWRLPRELIQGKKVFKLRIDFYQMSVQMSYMDVNGHPLYLDTMPDQKYQTFQHRSPTLMGCVYAMQEGLKKLAKWQGETKPAFFVY